MGLLTGCRAYLCGAMSYVDDFGAGWRDRIKADLHDLGVLWLDPVCKPIDVGFEDRASLLACKRAKREGKYDFVAKRAGIIRRVDLRMVDISDFIVANIDITTHTAGTYEELYRAIHQQKPVLIHIDQGKENCPDWIIGAMARDHDSIFSTWTQVKSYLRRVHSGKDADDRWMFFDWEQCK